MRHRSWNRTGRLQAARLLRFEPLESRLQFAVDYPLYLSEAYTDVGTAYLAFSELPVDQLFYEVVRPTAIDLSSRSLPNLEYLDSTIGEYLGRAITMDTESDSNFYSTESADFQDQDADWLFNLGSTSIVDSDPGILDKAASPLMDSELQSIAPTATAISVEEIAWLGLAAPIQDQAFVVGLITESIILPTGINSRGPDLNDTSAENGGMQQVAILLAATVAETPPMLYQSQSSIITGISSSSPYPGIEFTGSNARDVRHDLQPSGTVGNLDAANHSTQSSPMQYHSLSILSSQPPLEIELDSQLPIDKSTPHSGRTSLSGENSNAVVVTGSVDGKATSRLSAMGMLPEGMLPIGSEDLRGITKTDRSQYANQHFIVQAALICDDLNSTAVVNTDQNENSLLDLVAVDLATSNRTLGVFAAGVVVFVAQSRFRSHKSLRNFWEEWRA